MSGVGSAQIYSDDSTRKWVNEGLPQRRGSAAWKCKQPLIGQDRGGDRRLRRRAQEFEDNPELVRGSSPRAPTRRARSRARPGEVRRSHDLRPD